MQTESISRIPNNYILRKKICDSKQLKIYSNLYFARRGLKPHLATKGCFLWIPHSFDSTGKPVAYLGINPGYSYRRSASIGRNFAARRAGRIPAKQPITKEKLIPKMMIHGEKDAVK